MSLTHTPAHTRDYPDRFIDAASDLGYSVVQDIDAEDPRSCIEDEHAGLWAFREPRIGGSVAGDLPEGNVAIDAFARFWDVYEATAESALILTQRYLAAFHPEKKISVATQTIRGYSQSDWLDVVCAVEDGYGTPESHIYEFRQWAFGDVWRVDPDQGDGVSGIYADDPEDALQIFRENYEDEPSVTPTATDDAPTPTWPENEDERNDFCDWQFEVGNGDTLLGFRDWMSHRDEAELNAL